MPKALSIMNSPLVGVTDRFFFVLFGIVLVGVFSAYITPLLAALTFSDVFMFVNAWDEETHLTLQSSKELLGYPGYMASAAVVYSLHFVGVPGAVQNLLFDLIVIPGTALCVFLSLRNLGVPKGRSIAYVLLILFSSVLFNYANPYITEFYGPRHVSTFMPGFESYPSILRTPQPQLSYLIISLALLAWSKKKTWVWLLAPIPFLYFFVAVGYCFVVTLIVIKSLFPRLFESASTGKSIIHSACVGLGVYFISVAFFVFIAYAVEVYSGVSLSESLLSAYAETRAVDIPLSFVGLLPCIFLIMYAYLQGRNVGFEGIVFIYVAFGILLLANIHMLSGYTVSYKNFHDYVFSIMSGIALCLFFEAAHRNNLIKSCVLYSAKLVLLMCIMILVLISQKFDWRKLQFQVYIGRQISSEDQVRVMRDPLRAIVLDPNVSAKLAYAYAGIEIPPFSYQYYFLSYDRDNLDMAMKATRAYYPPESPQVTFFGNMHKNILKRGTPLSSSENVIPPISKYFFVEPKGSPFIYYP